MKKKTENLLIIADSDHDANMLYAVRMFVPDPFIYLRLRGKSYVVLSDLEIDRARRQAPHCSALSLAQYQAKLIDAGAKRPGFAEIVAAVLRGKGVKSLVVPGNFPFGLVAGLRRGRIRVKPRPGQFFPEREHKSPQEVRNISAALTMAEVGMAEAIQVLRSAKIGKGRRLLYH